MPNAFPIFCHAIAAVLLLFSFAAGSSGQQTRPVNPTMPSQRSDSEKDSLYAQYTNHKRVLSPEEQANAYAAAKFYLLKFGGDGDEYAREVKKFVADYERVRREDEVFVTYNAKKYAKTFELGRALLRTEPEDFLALAILAEAGYENAAAGDAKLNAETIDYTRHAIKILVDGKLTKPDPFKNMEMAHGFLNFALGWFLKDQSPVEAAAAFRNAARSDSPYRNDPSVYHRLGIAILKGEFAALTSEYNEKFGNKRSSAEQTAMLNRIQNLAERAIDAYARAVALSTSPQQQDARAKILAQLTALYQNFHNNSDAGLNELISNVLTKPLP